MKFGKQLQDLRREGWLEYYVDYKHVKKVIKQLKCDMGSAAPSDTLRSFLDVLMEQLDKVNAFFLKEQAALTAEWQTVNLSVPESLTKQQKKLLMRWLKFRLRTASGKTVTYRSSSSNSFTTFCEVYEKVQGLRQFVATNYIGFVKSMKKFEKKTGLRVAHSFMPRLQRSKFFVSACLAILLTEVDCAAKDLLPRLGFQGSSELNHEFCCSLCNETLNQPIVLSCTHRFCWQCTASSVTSCPADSEWRCPTCSRPQELDPAVLCVNSGLQKFIVEHVSKNEPDRGDAASDAAAPEDVFAALWRIADADAAAQTAPEPGLTTAAAFPAEIGEELVIGEPGDFDEAADAELAMVLETAKGQQFYSDFFDLANMGEHTWPFMVASSDLAGHGEFSLSGDSGPFGMSMQYNEDGLFEDLLAELPSPRGLTPRDDAAPLSPTSALAAVSLPMSPLRCPSAVGKTGRARKASKAIQEEQQDHWDEDDAEAEEEEEQEEEEEEGEERAPSPELTPSARKRQKRLETQRSYRKRMDRATELHAEFSSLRSELADSRRDLDAWGAALSKLCWPQAGSSALGYVKQE